MFNINIKGLPEFDDVIEFSRDYTEPSTKSIIATAALMLIACVCFAILFYCI